MSSLAWELNLSRKKLILIHCESNLGLCEPIFDFEDRFWASSRGFEFVHLGVEFGPLGDDFNLFESNLGLWDSIIGIRNRFWAHGSRFLAFGSLFWALGVGADLGL